MRNARMLFVYLACVGVTPACVDTNDDDVTGQEQLGEPVSESRLIAIDPPQTGGPLTVEEGSATPGASLCQACTTNADCGGSGALCLRRSDGAQFCGRDCRTSGCPTSYSCMKLSTTVSQCVPPQLDCTRAATDGGVAPVPDAGTTPSAPITGDVPSTPYCSPVSSWSATSAQFELEVLRLTNVYRQTPRLCGTVMYGVAPPLTMSPALRCSARVHAKDMQDRMYFSHTTLGSNLSPFQRMTSAGYSYRAAAENIAAGYTTPQQVVDGWIGSVGHCQNLMSPAYTQLGVGHYGSGSYWVQNFGSPL